METSSKYEVVSNVCCLKAILGFVVLAISTSVVATYLRFEPGVISRILLFSLTTYFWFRSLSDALPSKREVLTFGFFSVAMSICLVLGFHIVIGDDTYSGLKDENYISRCSWVDLLAFFAMIPSLFLLSFGGFRLIGSRRLAEIECETCELNPDRYRIDFKFTVLFALLLFCCWVPYLVVYYPGLIFGDTLSSLNQILGYAPWSNHHPAPYTAFLGLCILTAHLMGFGNAAGCGLYCVLQMLFIAGCLSYFASWIMSLFALSRFAKVAIRLLFLVLFGLSPHFASYSIALWKDPIFSVALLMLSLFVFDAVLGRRVYRTLLRIVAFAMFSLLVVFFRNNGIYIVLALCVLMAVACFVDRRRRILRFGDGSGRNGSSQIGVATHKRSRSDHGDAPFLPIISVSCFVVLLYCFVSGPVYSMLNIEKSPISESLGIPINQMARVAAYDGEMDQADREYLDRVFPLEEYKSHYYPCCTDNLKWNEEFNSEALMDGFPEHWVSMLLKNPIAYLEAWELQTFGYWSINQHAVDDFGNISGGVPRNASEGYSDQLLAFGIDPEVGIQNETIRGLFPLDEAFLSIGILFWIVIYLACCMIASRRTRWVLALVPSLALMLTLFVASPIWYWPRYAATLEFSLPLYIALFFLLSSQKRPFSIMRRPDMSTLSQADSVGSM